LLKGHLMLFDGATSSLFDCWIKWRKEPVVLEVYFRWSFPVLETFFDNVAETTAKTAFKNWRAGNNPLYYEESGVGRMAPKMQRRTYL
jgi:hypothetical protein